MPPRSWMPSTSTTLPVHALISRDLATSQPPPKAGGRQPQTAAKDRTVRPGEPAGSRFRRLPAACAVHLVAMQVRSVTGRLGPFVAACAAVRVIRDTVQGVEDDGVAGGLGDLDRSR